MTHLHRFLLLVLVLLCSPLVFAHTGAAGHVHAGFADGALHPLTGSDHLVALLGATLLLRLA